ncbi:zf-HC2 domain-containing protein [Desulfolucanica intricata]|uniref:zf-HC2 domain-containing protein n=1 Tax=Desulfolucanica intricata TaxID=1285191 RepID=UPI000829D3A0|nr:zf-HC2 domain-containing protein [Desulfolucanica intricata]
MSKISCEIIKDLLPLYYDEVCSSESKKMVEGHLAECSSCKRELDRIKTDIKIPKETAEKNRRDVNVIKGIADFWKRSKVKAFVNGLIGAAALFTVIFLGYTWDIKSVPTDVIKIKNVSKLSNGYIVYHVELTDGYALNRIKYDMDEDGNFYLTPLRPIIKKKAQPPYGLAKGYDLFNVEGQEKNHDGAEIKALYYGTPKDKILIWKKGMDLPKASDEIEEMFVFE